MAAVLFFVLLTRPDNHIDWQDFTSEALQHSQAARLPVLIEFTAEWCLNCEVLKKTAYANQDVVRAVRKAKLIPLRIDMTDFNDGHRELLEKYGGTALPFALLIDGNGNVTHRFRGMFTANTLKKAIDHVRLSTM